MQKQCQEQGVKAVLIKAVCLGHSLLDVAMGTGVRRGVGVDGVLGDWMLIGMYRI